MERTLAAFAAGAAPLAARLVVARGLARAVAALHRRGVIHGALSPDGVLIAGDGEAVVLAPPRPADPLALAGWAAPEVLRGGRPSPSADAFATAALAQLALVGRGPFDAGGAGALEVARRALFEAPRPARLDAPSLPADVDEALARLLERSARRRGTPEELLAALDAALAAEAPASSASRSWFDRLTTNGSMTSSSSSSSSASRSWFDRLTTNGSMTSRNDPFVLSGASRNDPFVLSGASPQATRSRRTRSRRTRTRRTARSALAALAGRIPPSPLHRAVLAALPLLAVAFLLVPRSDAALAREVGRALARRDLAAARAALDAAPRRADRPLVEKLRGDLACARGAPDECLRRYRTALAARPELRGDEALRRNVRALLSGTESCATQRSAALLAGQLRDPEALPALQAARRSAGVLAFLCTGDALDRAIAATRAAAR